MSSTRVATRCPQCDKSLRVDPQLWGKSVRCPACQHRFVVASVDLGQTTPGTAAGEAFETRAGALGEGVVPDGMAVASPAAKPPTGKIGRYELHEVLGRGAFGVVSRAYDPLLDRQVALKLPLFSSSDKKKTQRFLNEAKAAARLRHSNIVPLYESGQLDGRLYLAAEFVKGKTLAEAIKEARPSIEQSVHWVRDVAGALAYAHEQGIVHRDIKPQNIMIDAAGRPQIMDFGLAKRLDDDSTMTVDGSVMGTPAYMPPEQARGETAAVGPHSDQYSLGVVLYELLTGERPFDGTSAVVIAKVISVEPRAPTSINPAIPRDLEAICLKAMEKEPSRRYPSAAALADDLGRFAEGHAILARPIGRAERVWRWCRRQPVMAGLIAAVAVLLVGGTAISSSLAMLASRRAQEADRQATAAENASKEAVREKTAAVLARAEADKKKSEAEQNADLARRHLYVAHMNLAQSAWESNRIGAVLDLLDRHRPRNGEEDLRGFEWYHWNRLCHRELFTIERNRSFFNSVAFSPDGKWIASDGFDNMVKLWEVATGEETRTLKGHTSGVTSVAFSPDGKRIASASYDKTVKLWDAATGEETRTLKGHTKYIRRVAFSPDGKQIASASADQTVKLWDAETGEERHTLQGHSPVVHSVAFSPDGKQIASASLNDFTVTLWDTATGEETRTLKGHTADVSSVAFSPDGKRIASGSWDKTVKIWDVTTGEEMRTLRGHTDQVICVAFSPDSKRIGSASWDQTVKLWDALTGNEKQTLRGHTNWVTEVAFSPDGKRIASAGGGGVKLWDAAMGDEWRTFQEHAASLMDLSTDGRQIASAGAVGTVKLWNVGTAEVARTLRGHTKGLVSVAISPDGTRIASAGHDQTVKLWDAETGDETRTLKGSAFCVVFSPDGNQLAAACGNGTVKLWDAATGEQTRTLDGKYVYSVAFSPDGKHIASAGGDGTESGHWTTIWDVATGEAIGTLKGHTRIVNCAAFSPDGKRIASASGDNTVKLWDADTREELRTLKGHAQNIPSVVFSPDGKRIASGSYDHTVKLWDVATGQEILSLKAVGIVGANVAFNPAGTQIAFPAGGTVQIWDAPRVEGR